MASENGQEADPLAESVLDRLRTDPYRFDFFRALRELENAFPDAPKIGRSLSPAADPVRFGRPADLGFETSTLAGLDPGENGRPPRLDVRFFGLVGPNGPLPSHFTEYARERQRNYHDPTLGAFLDVFHHRLIGLFYRAWAVNQKAVDFDRPEEARFPGYVGSMVGIGQPGARHRDRIPDEAKHFYAGRLAAQTRNAEGLEAILEDFFEVPVAVESFVGHWLLLPEDDRCRLGGSPDTATLGATAIVGERLWDVQTRIRLDVGPIGLARFRDFLPVGRSFDRVGDWVAFYTNLQFHWDIRLRLVAAEVPPTQLGGGSLLGWTTWLQSLARTADADDLVIDPAEIRFPATSSQSQFQPHVQSHVP